MLKGYKDDDNRDKHDEDWKHKIKRLLGFYNFYG